MIRSYELGLTFENWVLLVISSWRNHNPEVTTRVRGAHLSGRFHSGITPTVAQMRKFLNRIKCPLSSLSPSLALPIQISTLHLPNVAPTPTPTPAPTSTLLLTRDSLASAFALASDTNANDASDEQDLLLPTRDVHRLP
ncbi:hypothetical protein NL676_038443 [Syzygium grande]|nr:hypothetical protein NL676_038443 [Syzygium grande]